MSTAALKVFCVRVRRRPGWPTILTQPRVVVAAPSRAAAARAIRAHDPSFTDAAMRKHGAVTVDPIEVKAAMSSPGAVFVEPDYESSHPVGKKFYPLGSPE